MLVEMAFLVVAVVLAITVQQLDKLVLLVEMVVLD
jgi:hypothetical protein